MKAIDELIKRKQKEMEVLKEKFYNTPTEEQKVLERLDNKIEKLRYYIMGLQDAKIYIEQER